jgi:hypothetical protein
MECGEGLLPSFSLSFTPHLQRHAGPNLRLWAHAVDLLLPLAIAPVAPCHGMRGGRQQLVVETCQGLFQRGCKELLACLPQRGAPQEPTPQSVSFVQSRLGPTAPIKQGVDLGHELPQSSPLREAPGEPPPLLPCALAQVPWHDEMPIRVEVDALLCKPFFLAGCSLRCRGARTPFGPFGLLGRETLPRAGSSTQHRLDHLGEDRKRPDVMRHPMQDLREGWRRAR